MSSPSRKFTEDHFILACGTLIFLGVLASVVILFVTGHDAEVFRVMSLIGQGFTAVIVLFGLNRTANIGRKNGEMLQNGIRSDLSEIKETVRNQGDSIQEHNERTPGHG